MKGHDSYSLVLSELTAEAEHGARSIRSRRRRVRDGADARRDPGPPIEKLIATEAREIPTSRGAGR
jgi:hypothetical protein